MRQIVTGHIYDISNCMVVFNPCLANLDKQCLLQIRVQEVILPTAASILAVLVSSIGWLVTV